MGALQPGLPNPAMLPRDWPLWIVDLKDWFFTIALHPRDTRRQTMAREAHSMFHQNAKGLHREFQISMEEARAIVKACAICSHHNGGCGLGRGVNPRGLNTNETWQM
ncbi:POK18 protein, partial [Agelaius phoeniceus]|nr:POK18 protein [Agelaius phoeniceus]